MSFFSIAFSELLTLFHGEFNFPCLIVFDTPLIRFWIDFVYRNCYFLIHCCLVFVCLWQVFQFWTQYIKLSVPVCCFPFLFAPKNRLSNWTKLALLELFYVVRWTFIIPILFTVVPIVLSCSTVSQQMYSVIVHSFIVVRS